MYFFDLPIEFSRLPGVAPAWRAEVDADRLLDFCRAAREARARLVSLWGADDRDRDGAFSLHVALALTQGLVCLRVALPDANPRLPDLSGLFPGANRMQRAACDLLGLASAAEDTRHWLRHANWPEDFFPLRRDTDARRQFEPAPEHYRYVKVRGEGAHEIPVGPIHAGIIEPGHFRFSVAGERVLRLEERLGWKHKGIDRRFEAFSLAEGHKLAGRVSGDSTVAFSWAFCQAAEALTGTTIPPRAAWLRALMLERERIANHLGDLGYLGNDAAVAFALAQFMRLKEDWVRASATAFGHRFMMDRVVPGGVAHDLDDAARAALRAQCDAIEGEVRVLSDIFDEHAGLQDRFMTTGRLDPAIAQELGVTGFAARASGFILDLRSQHPCPPYDALPVRVATGATDDVAARAQVRFDEVLESLRLIRRIADELPAGDIRAPLAETPAGGLGLGWIEGWRGEVFVALEAGPDGAIRRCFCHDPSWHIWPALEHAIMGNIVPDFPLINKSFNLSYSGPDL